MNRSFSSIGNTWPVHPKFPIAISHVPLKDDVTGVEIIYSFDVFLHLRHVGTPSPVDVQDANQQSVNLIGNRQDRREKTGGIPEVGTEGRIGRGG